MSLDISVTDQFCGAGGSSQGARRLGLEVQLAMNHWQLAVETHNTNFPETEHDCADVSAADPRRYWATDILITSPECTNHSVAKGAKRASKQRSLLDAGKFDPSAERSRATMWDVPRFAEYHRYNIIIVENVVDARKWRLWDSWIHAMTSLGYEYEVVYLNSMFAHLDPFAVCSIDDFSPQSRDRMYVIFWKKGNRQPDLDFRPKAFCPMCNLNVDAVQSWKKKPGQPYWRWGRYKAQYVYCCPTCASIIEPYHFAAANAIDWSIEAQRIGNRKRPLKPKTLARIQKGLERFAGQHLMIDIAFTHAGDRRQNSLVAPLRTLTTRQSTGLVFMPFLLGYANQQAPAKSATDVLRTFHTENGQGVVLPPFLMAAGGRQLNGRSRDVTEAMGTQTGTDTYSVVIPPFLNINYTPGYNRSLDDPLATHTASDHHSLTIPAMTVTRVTDGGGKGERFPVRPMDAPLPTQVTATQNALMYLPFMIEQRGTQDTRSIDDSMSTVCAAGNHHWLTQMPFISAYYGASDKNAGVHEPVGTFTSKEHHALVQPDQVPNVEDCLFRMLQPHEIGRGMAFDDGYVVLGTKRERVKQYGNAVTPPAMLRLLERCVDSLR